MRAEEAPTAWFRARTHRLIASRWPTVGVFEAVASADDLEAALLLEAGLRRSFDKVIVVSCKPQQRIERWEKRLKVDAETARREVTRRMMAQAPDEAKIQAADFVVDNSGSVEDTRKQVQKIHETLVSQAQVKSA